MTTKVVAITGASSGIGLAAAKLFSSKGWTVYNLSRRPSNQSGIRDIPTDVTQQPTVRAGFDQIYQESGRLDLLINNAGYGISGAVEFTTLAQAKDQFDVNFFGALDCTQAALPLLRESGGRIIFISSAAAIFAIPFQAFYSATKAATNTLATALANEVKQFGISCCALQLGDVHTGFSDARIKTHTGDDVYQGTIHRSTAIMEQDEAQGVSPQVIAQAIYKTALRRKVKPVYTVGAKYKLFALLNKLLPNNLVNLIIWHMYAK